MTHAHAILLKTSNQAHRKATRETKQLGEPKIPKRRLKLLNLFIYITFSLGFLAFVYVCYLLFWPNVPMRVNSKDVVQPVSISSGYLTYTIDLCKYTDATPTLYKKIVGVTDKGVRTGLPFMPILGVANKGCGVTTASVALPPGLEPGEYTLYSDVQYPVNPLRTVHVYWQSQEFTVVQ